MVWSQDHKRIHRIPLKAALELPIEEKLSYTLTYPPKPQQVVPVVDGSRDDAPPRPADVDKLAEIFDAPLADDAAELSDPDTPVLVEAPLE